MPSLDKIMMNVNSCCCGCSLRTGTLILLWLGLIGAIFQVLSLFAPTQVIVDTQGHPHEVKNPAIVTLLQFQYFIFCGIVSGFGLYGVSNRRPSFLLPYVYVNVVEMILMCVLGIIFIFLAIFWQDILEEMTSKSQVSKDDAKLLQTFVWSMVMVVIISGVIGLVLNWYFTSVVYRYYKELESSVQTYQGGAPPRYDAQLKA